MPNRFLHLTSHLGAALAVTLACSSCEEKAQLQADITAVQSQTEEVRNQINQAEAESVRLQRELDAKGSSNAAAVDPDMVALEAAKAKISTEVTMLRNDLAIYRQRTQTP